MSQLERLSSHRVFSIERTKLGLFEVREGFDGYFSVVLTPEELRALGQEIIDMVTVKSPTEPPLTRPNDGQMY